MKTSTSLQVVLEVLFLSTFTTVSLAGAPSCASPTSNGCGLPSGPAWVPRWSMRSSLYTYCYEHCPLAYFEAHKNLGVFDGVVAFDHYWTHQGMPCINGIPQEFAAQDAITIATKATFPGARVIQYRIGTAVPYDNIVHSAMVEHPEWFVRWHHAPNDNMTVCTVSPEAQTGRPGDNCAWEIRAGMYDFSQPIVQSWWLQNIIQPVMRLADGAWIDGDGPDNGAYQCAGNYNYDKLLPPYPANNISEVSAFCAGEQAAVAAAHVFLYANGGIDPQACVEYINQPTALPQPTDTPAECAAKVLTLSKFSPGRAVGVASDRTGGRGYTDDTAAVTVAFFMIVRQEQWYFGVTQFNNTLNDATAALLLRDDGAPLGNFTTPSPNIFQRQFERATVSLDCNSFTATFTATTSTA